MSLSAAAAAAAAVLLYRWGGPAVHHTNGSTRAYHRCSDEASGKAGHGSRDAVHGLRSRAERQRERERERGTMKDGGRNATAPGQEIAGPAFDLQPRQPAEKGGDVDLARETPEFLLSCVTRHQPSAIRHQPPAIRHQVRRTAPQTDCVCEHARQHQPTIPYLFVVTLWTRYSRNLTSAVPLSTVLSLCSLLV